LNKNASQTVVPAAASTATRAAIARTLSNVEIVCTRGAAAGAAARDCVEALVLAVCSGEDGDLADQLMTLADAEVSHGG